MSSQEYRPVSEIIPDDFPTLSPLPKGPTPTATSSNSFISFFKNISLQTWIIVILILTFLGINIFAYLAEGTEKTVSIFSKIFGPILQFIGYNTLSTTQQIIDTSASSVKAGVDIVSNTSTDTIDVIKQTTTDSSINTNMKKTSTNNSSDIPQGQMAMSSLPVQNHMQETGSKVEYLQQNALEKALENSKQTVDQVSPDDSRSSIQTTGKSGWCYIGEEQGIRTCSEIGVNDVCMSGNVFPTQAVCINPNLRP
jgi:hypothetical protein